MKLSLITMQGVYNYANFKLEFDQWKGGSR